MEVDVIRSTDKPEQLFCQAGRGDYLDGYIGDTGYQELMKDVDYDEDDVEAVNSYINKNGSEWIDEKMSGSIETAARTRAFVRKQLSRGHHGLAEHPQITFAANGVSRVTMAQITRHRHMTFDVQSQRYVDFSEKEAVVPPVLMSEESDDHVNRHNGLVNLAEEDRERWRREYETRTDELFEMYQEMVEGGIPKEDARFVLPVGTPVNMTFSGNARTFMHVFNLRQKANAQHEIRELCNELAPLLKDWAPYMFTWYDENRPHKIGP